MADVDKVLARLTDDEQRIREKLSTFLRFASISAQPDHADDMGRCAHWLADQLTAAGLKVEVVATEGHPVVLADSDPGADDRAKPTLLFYGHYDVQPAGEESLWESKPFEPTIKNGAVVARGAADDKGQLMTHLAALQAWHDAGAELPVRIKCLYEGEEEIGSPHLPDFVKSQAKRLACDYVVLSDTAKHDTDTPALVLSTRGLVYKHVTVTGPAKDLHSGQYGGAVANPANVLAGLLGSLHDHRRRVSVPGFYDRVCPVIAADADLPLPEEWSDEQLTAKTGSPGPFGEEGYTHRQRCTIRPSLDINGITAGYQGAGSATIIPTQASAKLSMRLVADQDPVAISEAFDRALRSACPSGVELAIETTGLCGPYLAPLDSLGVQVARHVLEKEYGHPPVVSREGGTLPILPLFKEILDADSIMLGFAMPDCNLHSPNEFFHLRDLRIGSRCIVRYIHDIAAKARKV